MSLDDFWYEDCDLMYCYVEAYYARLHKQSWVNGQYIQQAVGIALTQVMPSAISIGLGLVKNKKDIRNFNDVKYFDKPIPDLVKEQQTKQVVGELNENERMELDRKIVNKFR